MAEDRAFSAPPTEVFKALADPVRWSIITQMALVDELACLSLEDTLPVSKPTISYHTKILHHAGLISVRKEGRNYFYSLRRDVLRQVLDSLWELAPSPRPVVGQHKDYLPSGVRQIRPGGGTGRPQADRPPHRRDLPESVEEGVVLTW